MRGLTKYFLIITGLIIIGFSASYVVYLSDTGQLKPNPDLTNGGVFCTMDAKLCPDGSYVGRTGPNCEFAECPAVQGSGIRGTVLLGPICPVQQIPPLPECADKPYKTRLAVTDSNQIQIIREFESGEDGKFTIELVPGEYFIRSAAIANILPYCSSPEILTVKERQYTEITVLCDTGIR